VCIRVAKRQARKLVHPAGPPPSNTKTASSSVTIASRATGLIGFDSAIQSPTPQHKQEDWWWLDEGGPRWTIPVSFGSHQAIKSDRTCEACEQADSKVLFRLSTKHASTTKPPHKATTATVTNPLLREQTPTLHQNQSIKLQRSPLHGQLPVQDQVAAGAKPHAGCQFGGRPWSHKDGHQSRWPRAWAASGEFQVAKVNADGPCCLSLILIAAGVVAVVVFGAGSSNDESAPNATLVPNAPPASAPTSAPTPTPLPLLRCAENQLCQLIYDPNPTQRRRLASPIIEPAPPVLSDGVLILGRSYDSNDWETSPIAATAGAPQFTFGCSGGECSVGIPSSMSGNFTSQPANVNVCPRKTSSSPAS
jgi:hypothetical protein